MVLKTIHTYKIVGTAQQNLCCQGHNQHFPDITSIRLFAMMVCTVEHTSDRCPK
jgi:hypothetical protein